MNMSRDVGSTPRRFLNPRDGLWHTQITQGEAYVSTDDNEVLSTVLGSCVAACIRDPFLRIGGMNHFLLPEGGAQDGIAMRYGVHAMECLINALLSRGATRGRLEAKLFGGANVMASLAGVGWRNADFAERFLELEGISVVGGDLRGTAPRRVQFWPTTGRARQLAIHADLQKLMQQEIDDAYAVSGARREDSELELF